MDWLKKILGLTGKKEKHEVKIIESTSYVGNSSPCKTPCANEPAVDLEGDLKEAFTKFIKTADPLIDFLFFDPEEEECFVYRIDEKSAVKLMSFPVDGWNDYLLKLKSYNYHQINLSENIFNIVISVSFTNFGERVCVGFYKADQIDADELSMIKKQMITKVNRIKPATCLTQKNIDHLMQMIEQAKAKKPGISDEDYLKALLKEGAISPEDVEENKQEHNIRKILSLPLPRKQIVKSIAVWFGIKYVDAELIDKDEKIARMIPEDVARSMGILAFSRECEKIKVAVWNPFDEKIINKLGEIFGENYVLALSCEEDIRDELGKIYDEE